MSGRSLKTIAETVTDLHEPSSPVRSPSSKHSSGALSGLLTPKVPAMSPMTPKSDFHAYAENSLSPLPSQTRSPSSRDWASYPVSGPNNFAADFVSTKRRFDEFSPAHLSFSTPTVALPAGSMFDDSSLDDILQPEGFVSIDTSSQTQLICNSRALATRLQGSVEKDSRPFELLPQSAEGQSGGATKKSTQRKRRKMTSLKNTFPCNSEDAVVFPAPVVGNKDQMLKGVMKQVTPIEADQRMCRGRDSKPFPHSLPHLSDHLVRGGQYPAPQQIPTPVAGGAPHIQSPPQPTVYLGEMESFLAAGMSPMAVRLNEAPNISPAVTTLGARTVSCNCKKSRCLKLYCDCFRAQQYCDGCNCQQCANSPEHENDRQRSMISITERNPEAFKPRIACDSPAAQIEDSSGLPSVMSGSGVQYHFSGCHCKKSACLKKYCECYQAQIPCQARCRCLDCKNTIADGIFVGLSSNSQSPGVDFERDTLHMPRQQPNALVRGLVKATGARVLDPQPLLSLEREPLVKRENLIVREAYTDPAITKSTGTVWAGISGRITSRSLPVPIAGATDSNNKVSTGSYDNSHVSPTSSDASPNGSTNSTWTASTATCSSGPCYSNVSVDVLSAVLAARLRDAGTLIGAGTSTEACIREELLLMQQKGILMSAPSEISPQQGSFEYEGSPIPPT